MGTDAYTPSTLFPTWPLQLIKDGESVEYQYLMNNASPGHGLIAKLADGLEYFKTGNPTLEGTVTILGSIVGDDNPTITNNASVNGDLDVQGNSTLASLDVAAQAGVGGNLGVGGDITAGTSGGGGSYMLQSRSVPRTALAIFLNSNGTVGIGSLSLDATETGLQAIDLPHGAVLTKCTFAVDPANASPPAGTKVAGRIVKRDLSTGATTTVAGPTTDPTSGASYGAYHTFDVQPGATETVNRATYEYFVQLDGETGFSAANVGWYGTSWTCTMTALDVGAA